MVHNTSTISFLLIWIDDDERNSINCAFRMASSSDKLGPFSLTCKYCKYRLGDNISGDVANTQSNIINDDSF